MIDHYTLLASDCERRKAVTWLLLVGLVAACSSDGASRDPDADLGSGARGEPGSSIGDGSAPVEPPATGGESRPDDAIALDDPQPSEDRPDPAAETADARALAALRTYLALPRTDRPPLSEQEFACAALGADTAQTARTALWADHADFIAGDRQAETDARSITLDSRTLLYDYGVFGDAPVGGRSLYISLHGGGQAEASVNDQQWENQKRLYQPAEGIYLSPRAPTNNWNLWHEPHVDALLDRLITNLIVLEGVDANRVYVMGYSAGGDGVYQLAPRMADRWAAAAMMAGHPNDARPDSLRNIGFTAHVGGLDTAFDRNLVAVEWGALLDALQATDPAGYAHQVEVHADKPHWMDLEDAVAVPWMADFTRDPLPDKVVWLQDDVAHDRFYWLAVLGGSATPGARVVATRSEQQIEVQATGVSRLLIRLTDTMIDLDQPVQIVSGGAVLFDGIAPRTIATLAATIAERGDPESVFSAEVGVQLP